MIYIKRCFNVGFAVSNVDFLEPNGITDENLMIGQIPRSSAAAVGGGGAR